MKNLIMAAVLFVGLSTFAQEKTLQKSEIKTEKLTSEQRQQLKLKELTLKLDLNASQQQEMAKIIADQHTKMSAAKAERKIAKEKGVKPTADEKFARKNKQLNARIAMQQRMKSILNEDQMKKWDEMKSEKKKNYKHAAKGKHKKHSAPKGN